MTDYAKLLREAYDSGIYIGSGKHNLLLDAAIYIEALEEVERRADIYITGLREVNSMLRARLEDDDVQA